MNEYGKRSQKMWQVVLYKNLQKIDRVTTRIKKEKKKKK